MTGQERLRNERQRIHAEIVISLRCSEDKHYTAIWKGQTPGLRRLSGVCKEAIWDDSKTIFGTGVLAG